MEGYSRGGDDERSAMGRICPLRRRRSVSIGLHRPNSSPAARRLIHSGSQNRALLRFNHLTSSLTPHPALPFHYSKIPSFPHFSPPLPFLPVGCYISHSAKRKALGLSASGLRVS